MIQIMPRPASPEAYVLYQLLESQEFIAEADLFIPPEYPYSAWNVIKALSMFGYVIEEGIASYGLNDRGRLNKSFRLQQRCIGSEMRRELQVFKDLMEPKIMELKKAA